MFFAYETSVFDGFVADVMHVLEAKSQQDGSSRDNAAVHTVFVQIMPT